MKITRQIGSLALVAIGALAYASTASAVVITNIWDVSRTFESGYIDESPTRYFTHDINDNLGSPLAVYFNSAEWAVFDAVITLTMHDDSNIDGREYAKFRWDTNSGNWVWSNEINGTHSNPEYFSFDVTDFLSDGILTVFVQGSGDFYIDHSRLVVMANSVPEPGTLALLSLGLLGIGFGARRRIK